MDKSLSIRDWSLLQSFLAVAETGSLSAAARHLGRSQPTVGRQIHALEQELDTVLFERHARGFRLSVTGAAMVPMAEQMRDAIHAMSLTAAGAASRLEGTVRLTASVFMSHMVLPPIIARLRQLEPAIQIDLVPTDGTENLLFHEADIALRMYRPEQLDIVATHIGDLELGVFAATAYLDRVGRPTNAEDMMALDLVGYDTNDLIIRSMRDMGWPITRDGFAVRCDDQAAYWHLVRAGCGVGFSQVEVGRADPSVEELDFGLAIPKLPMWLATHQAMRQTPRVRRIWTLLAQCLRDGPQQDG